MFSVGIAGKTWGREGKSRLVEICPYAVLGRVGTEITLHLFRILDTTDRFKRVEKKAKKIEGA